MNRGKCTMWICLQGCAMSTCVCHILYGPVPLCRYISPKSRSGSLSSMESSMPKVYSLSEDLSNLPLQR